MDPQQLPGTIASAQAGSGQAYQELLEAYGPRLYGYFMRATGNHHDAEDLLGELRLRLGRRLGEYDHRGRFEPWLFRVAANLVRDRIRRRRVRPGLSDPLQESDEMPLDSQLASDAPPVDAKLIAEEAHERVDAALARLDAKTREMILLRHFAQLSFREIAEMEGCPLGTVLAKVHRGLRKLRELIEHDDPSRT
jgi:RNA polymerase sigma-70 factor (ECF subfamily)